MFPSPAGRQRLFTSLSVHVESARLLLEAERHAALEGVLEPDDAAAHDGGTRPVRRGPRRPELILLDAALGRKIGRPKGIAHVDREGAQLRESVVPVVAWPMGTSAEQADGHSLVESAACLLPISLQASRLSVRHGEIRRARAFCS